MSTITRKHPKIHYPDSDGQPMADNTLQFDWISILKWNLDYQFANDPNVFVAGDHLIYPTEGSKVCLAPDVYVALGRPKGDRGSYKAWEEGGIFPQVIFEIWSPSNRFVPMQKKFEFYQEHGAEEYYIIYPVFPASVDIWKREGERLIAVRDVAGWRSPRLGIRFGITDGEINVLGPGTRLFVNPCVIAAQRDAEYERAEKLAAKLRELGIDPDSI